MTGDATNVFINCPFDVDYRPLFDAAVFAIFRSGFTARSALEVDDGGKNRFDKICGIVSQCDLGMHDISRVETDGDPPLPRFNMPFELGVFIGAQRLGGKAHRKKRCIIFDTEPYRYQRFISDISGHDIHAHGGSQGTIILELATWLRAQGPVAEVPGGVGIAEEYEEFRLALPEILLDRGLAAAEMQFGDYCAIIAQYLKATAT